jgi:hypothetical protein
MRGSLDALRPQPADLADRIVTTRRPIFVFRRQRPCRREGLHRSRPGRARHSHGLTARPTRR